MKIYHKLPRYAVYAGTHLYLTQCNVVGLNIALELLLWNPSRRAHVVIHSARVVYLLRWMYQDFAPSTVGP